MQLIFLPMTIKFFSRDDKALARDMGCSALAPRVHLRVIDNFTATETLHWEIEKDNFTEIIMILNL